MKNTIINVGLLCLMTMSIAACHDDEFSSKHVYTDEEITIMDSIAAAKQNVDADLVVICNISAPQNNEYAAIVIGDGDDDIDPAKIMMESFNIASRDALITALDDKVLTLFAVSGSTNTDYLTGYTANGLGYWFTAGGDVTTWGETAALYNEFYTDVLTFNIGQFPEACSVGDEIRLVEMVTDGDYRVGFVFNISIVEPK